MNSINFSGMLIGQVPAGKTVAVNTKNIDRIDNLNGQSQLSTRLPNGQLQPLILFNSSMYETLQAYQKASSADHAVAQIKSATPPPMHV